MRSSTTKQFQSSSFCKQNICTLTVAADCKGALFALPIDAGKRLAFLLCIQHVSCFNLSPEACVLLSAPAKCWNDILK
jgi:hypothetical protein